MRTVPVPTWVKAAVDNWLTAAGISAGPAFRAMNNAGRVATSGFSPKVIWGGVKPDARNAVSTVSRLTICGAPALLKAKNFRKIDGHRDLWGLATILGRQPLVQPIAGEASVK